MYLILSPRVACNPGDNLECYQTPWQLSLKHLLKGQEFSLSKKTTN